MADWRPCFILLDSLFCLAALAQDDVDAICQTDHATVTFVAIAGITYDFRDVV